MAVMLANAQLTAHARAHQFARDAHGFPVAGAVTVTTTGPFPGAITEPEELTGTAPYRLRLDPRHSDLREDDEVTDGLGRKFIVRAARRIKIPGDDAVDFIRVTADLDPPKVP